MASIAQEHMTHGLAKYVKSPLIVALVFFLLALPPRTLSLDVFVGPDELAWVIRSGSFAQGIAEGNLRETYQTGHPGVTLMWVQTSGAWLRYGLGWLTGSVDWSTINAADLGIVTLAARRQVMGVTNALIIALLAVLVHQIFGYEVAWLAGFLLVFEPFPLTEARALRTEGVVMGLSALTLLSLLYYLKAPGWRRAVLAGLFTGLALLSKVSALALVPVGLVVIAGNALFAPFTAGHARWRRVAGLLLVWGSVVALTLFIFLPALWVDPGAVAADLYEYVGERADDGGPDGNSFFWGQATPHAELGPWFYLVVLAFRVGPWLWFGLLLLLLGVWGWPDLLRPHKVAVGVIGLYLVAYFILIAASSLKYDRYTAPMFPPLALLAALGYVTAWRWLTLRRPALTSWGWLMALLLLLLQFGQAWPHQPYYYTFWNPLLGGLKQAVHYLPIGTGDEGLEQVGAYLNTLPQAEQLSLASTHSQRIAPFFRGAAIDMSNEDGPWFLADYTFIYRAQAQRERHDIEILAYLAQKPLVFTLKLFDFDYGWLYRGVGAQYFGGDTLLAGRAKLHAFDLSSLVLEPGQTLAVTLYFRNEGQQPTDRFYVKLVDGNGYVWADGTVQPKPGFETAFRSRKAVVEGEAELRLPAGMPPGEYLLRLGYANVALAEAIGEFELPPDTPKITVTVTPPLAVHSIQPATVSTFTVQNELKLLGYELEHEQIIPAEQLWLTLYWQALRDVSRDYVVNLQLIDSTGAEAAYWLGRPVSGAYPTDQWAARQLIQDPWRLNLPANLTPADYTLRLTLVDAATQTEVAQQNLGRISVVTRRRTFELPDMQETAAANFDNQITLLGHNLFFEPLTGGGRLRAVLYWQAQADLPNSYTVFVHLLSSNGAVAAQHDGIPANGTIPTTDWSIGEVVEDRHQLEFTNLPPGEYQLVVGLYNAQTGERLPLVDGSAAVLLHTLDYQPAP